MGSLELIRWNQNRDDIRWAPANEIVVWAVAPPLAEFLKLKNSKGTSLFWQENTTKNIVYM